MGSFKLCVTMAGCLAASISIARAADLLPPPPPLPEEPYVSDVGGGWYLRGDVGVSRYEGDKFANPNAIATTTYYDRDFGSGAFAGGGVGYQFNHWFRADVTGEYRFSTGLSYKDKNTIYTPPGIGYAANGQAYYTSAGFNTTNYEKTATDYAAAVVLVNGYVDLGTWYGFTPFVGGGVGYAYHYLRGGSTDTFNVFGPFVDPNTGLTYKDANGQPIRSTGTSGGTIKNKDHGDFAWAVGAGVAYDVTPNVKLELAYRYLNLGTVQSGVINCYCDAKYAGFKVRDLESHDIKLGMRWAFGGEAAAPAFEPAPLVRKY